MDTVNTAVRFIVLAFVFIGVVVTLTGPDIAVGKKNNRAEKPAAATPHKNDLSISVQTPVRNAPDKTG